MRKYRAGSTGRFSTDLDFAVEDPDLGETVMETLDRAELHDLVTPLGNPQVDAKLDIGRRRVWPTPEVKNRYHCPSIEDTNSRQSPFR